MIDAVDGALGYALGIAASPIPIVAVVVMLFSDRPRRNSLVFTATWVSGISAVALAVALVPGLELDESPSGGRAWWRVAAGVGFVVLGIRNWRRRPRSDTDATLPRWLRTTEGRLGLGSAVVLGLVLSVLNPKDLTLAAAGGAAVASAEAGVGTTVLAVAVFTVVACSTVVLPVALYLVVGARSEEALMAVKDWMIRHNAVVLAVIWTVLGISFLVEGLGAS